MKSCFAFSLSLSCFIFIKTFNTEAAEYPYYICPNNTHFAPKSTYQSNLYALLSSLYSAAANSTDGFANATTGQNPHDRAYGLFLCRGDLGTMTCGDCVAAGKEEILHRCPNQRVSVIWFDECMLRYSNQDIFSIMELSPSSTLYNVKNATGNRWIEVLGETLLDVAKRASTGGSRKKVAAAEANFMSSQKMYILAQCTPDLTASDCYTCLQFGIGNLVQGVQGGRVLTPSCYVRYEFYPFYDVSALPVPAPPTVMLGHKGKSNKLTVITIAVAVPVGGVMVLLFLTCCLFPRKGKKTDELVQRKSGANELTTVESLQFDLATIQAATNDFSPKNKLGEGGFGEVFQGVLPNGQQIAVKRLSQSSRQGDEEFENEVLLVAKLQHRNLVRLLGFCLERDEKILAYEFVPNKSLDYFLFYTEKRGLLDWPLRYKIINGIARGMLYLHEDSQLRIIHRDLKCSNILLDSEMKPKISDFGMARIFEVNQTQASTNKIVGTFGYMSPEYAMHGEFSVKSDIYSFGILLLEIVCGKRNNFYHQLNGGEYLAIYAWNQWRDGMPLEVLDPAILDSHSRDQVLRCLHICLLCIQEDPALRPTMATVVLMLSNNSFNPPSPRHPAFFVQSGLRPHSTPMEDLELDQSNKRYMPSSTNGMSFTELCPR